MNSYYHTSNNNILLRGSFWLFVLCCTFLCPPACFGVDLPWGDVNVVVLTDVHSWIGGHSGEPKHNADYGDILSFYQRLHDHCRAHTMDLWFVVNGDWIDGTGLSIGGDISYLTPLLEKMEFDALNVGNHELYRTDVVNSFMRPGGFVESWGDRYLSSNVLYAPKQRPLGHRYRFLRGKNATVLTFGFLYNMDDASEAVVVETVESVVEESWFEDVLTNANNDPQGNFDAVMVLAHMDVNDQLVTVLLNKIRNLVVPSMPVQFITGHTHYRGVQIMDSASVSFEAGRYLDTVGFVSFPSQKTLLKTSGNRKLRNLGDDEEEEGEGETPAGPTAGGTEWPNVSDSSSNTSNAGSATTTPAPQTTTAPTNGTTTTTEPPVTPSPTAAPTPKHAAAELFRYVFIDADVATLEGILGVPGLATEDGARLSEFIFRTRSELGLLDLVGCTPQPYYLNRTVEERDSVWKVFLDVVVPYQLLKAPSTAVPNQQRIFLGPSAGFRYDLLGPQLILDDVIAVAPFNESIWSVGPNISGAVLVKLVKEILNAEPNPFDPVHENFMLSPPLDDVKPDTQYEIMAPEWGLQAILDGLKQIHFNGTVQQEESGFFSTDVWLAFIKDNWECKENDNTQSQTQSGQGGISHSDDSHHHSGGSASSSGHGHDKGVHSGAPKYQGGDEAKDKRRTALASVALGCVAVLGTLYIWQLHRDWLVKYRERQRLIFLADEENDHELI